MPGPIPKRSEDRVGHAHGPKSSQPDRVAREVVGLAGPELKVDAHPIAAMWYTELRKSPQAHQYFVESDWATAQIAVTVLTTALNQGDRMSSMLMVTFNDMSSRLLTTEADRRRMKIEIAKAAAEVPQDDQKVSYLAKARARKTS